MGVAILSCSVKECGGDPTHWIRRQAECIDAANSLASERRRPCNMQGHLSRSHETDVRVGKALRDDRLMEMSMRDDPQSQPISCTLRPGDETYPEGLSKLTPPAQLHVRGTLLPGEVSVAVVGSRECSAYGRDVAYRIASGVARAGILVVSGLARGIDAAAHCGALDAGGRTVAVLPCGLDRVYPASHGVLATRIVRQGALVTENDPGTTVAPWQFPRRNRIIAGMSLVTVVVEAAARSGARITANLAADAGREVMVVPGPVTSRSSEGCHALLSQGAHVCTGWRDVLAHLPPDVERQALARAATGNCGSRRSDLSARARLLLDALAGRAAPLEALLDRCALSVSDALSAVTELELGGLVRVTGTRIEPTVGPDGHT